ncbi:MAG: hypothetical protein JKX91_14520 [Rhizobiaceae bacterium]|nr:hypothetical protein [Rhizobiaceae bacterium]
MSAFLVKLRLYASTVTAIIGAGFVVGLGLNGNLSPQDLNGTIKFEAGFHMSSPKRENDQ